MDLVLRLPISCSLRALQLSLPVTAVGLVVLTAFPSSEVCRCVSVARPHMRLMTDYMRASSWLHGGKTILDGVLRANLTEDRYTFQLRAVEKLVQDYSNESPMSSRSVPSAAIRLVETEGLSARAFAQIPHNEYSSLGFGCYAPSVCLFSAYCRAAMLICTYSHQMTL